MATYTKFQSFVEAVAEKAHNLGSDQLKVALTNTNPTATCTKYSEITSPLPTTNLDGATPFNLTTSSSAQTSGTYKLVIADLTLTATGAVDPFRYVVIYNDTATNKEVIGYYDYGAEVNMVTSDTFVIDFSATNGLLTIA